MSTPWDGQVVEAKDFPQEQSSIIWVGQLVEVNAAKRFPRACAMNMWQLVDFKRVSQNMHIVDEAHSVPFVDQSTYDVGWAKSCTQCCLPQKHV